MIGYRLSSVPRPAGEPEPLLEYVLAGNGVHVRARREGLEALVPVGPCEVRGLPPVAPYVRLEQRVPIELLATMIVRAREVCAGEPREVLFHLLLQPDGWRLVEPPQEATAASVRPLDHAETTGTALIEVHSHHHMKAFFSRADDEDERAGFRLFIVLGEIFTKPTLRVRVGVHGYFWAVQPDEVFA